MDVLKGVTVFHWLVTLCVLSRHEPVLPTGGPRHPGMIPSHMVLALRGPLMVARQRAGPGYVPETGGRQLPLIAMRTPHSHYLTAVCFSTTLTLDSVNTLSLSLFARLTYPDFLLGRWPDSLWQSKVESVDSGPRVTEAVWNHPLFLQQYVNGIFIAKSLMLCHRRTQL